MKIIAVMVLLLAGCRQDPARNQLAAALGIDTNVGWESVMRGGAREWDGLLLEELKFTAPGVERTAFLLRPKGKQRFPGVVFLHGELGSAEEAVGISAPQRQGPGARLLAYRGFAVLVPKLKFKKPAGLPANAVVEVALRHATWLAREPAVDRRRIAAVGWGKGAAAALIVGALAGEVRAVYASGTGGGGLEKKGGWLAVLKVLAPRPVFFEATGENPHAHPDNVRALVNQAKPFYAAPDGIQLAVYPGSYRYLGDTAPDWLHLKLQAK
jgi:dienelactone hydrolase